MKPRITISISDTGELELLFNEAGRELLMCELKALNLSNDHFHMQAEDIGGAEIPLGVVPYRSTDRIITAAKAMLRPDEWDREFFPHVLSR